MNDSFAASIPRRLPWRDHPGVGDDRDVGELVGGHERLDRRQHGGGLGPVASNASTISGNPVASVSSPMVIWGSRRRSLENPGSRNPSPSSASKYRVDTS
jgi:hypothetical protein